MGHRHGLARIGVELVHRTSICLKIYLGLQLQVRTFDCVAKCLRFCIKQLEGRCGRDYTYGRDACRSLPCGCNNLGEGLVSSTSHLFQLLAGGLRKLKDQFLHFRDVNTESVTNLGCYLLA